MEPLSNHVFSTLSSAVHSFPRVMENSRQWNEGEAAFDLLTGPLELVWNLLCFLTHIVLMIVGIEKDDRTPDEMPDYIDLDTKDGEAEKEKNGYYYNSKNPHENFEK